MNITLSFVGPQHHTTSTTTSVPFKKPISFPPSITLTRTSNRYSRLAQPTFKPNDGISFTIPDSKIFNVTRKGGIIYVANATLLQSAPGKIPWANKKHHTHLKFYKDAIFTSNLSRLIINWRSHGGKQSSASMTINLLNVSQSSCDANQTTLHSCANAVTRKECESNCGFGSGSLK